MTAPVIYAGAVDSQSLADVELRFRAILNRCHVPAKLCQALGDSVNRFPIAIPCVKPKPCVPIVVDAFCLGESQFVVIHVGALSVSQLLIRPYITTYSALVNSHCKSAILRAQMLREL